MNQPEYICFDCAKGLRLLDVATMHVGHCDVCGEDGKEVAPGRKYGYPAICKKDGLVKPIRKMGGLVCPKCRVVLIASTH